MPAEVKGQLPEFRIETIEKNRNGLFQVVGKSFLELNKSNFLDALRNAPEFPIPLVTARYTVKHGTAEVEYVYEGIDTEEEPPTFELDVTMSEDPIRTHPNFEELKQKYGWLPNEGTFPEEMPQNSGGAYGGPQKKAVKNPLHGTDSYLVVGAIFRVTWVTKNLPASVLTGLGTVVDRPAGIEQFRLPEGGRKRNWLKLAPKIRLRGNCYEISEEYMLSGPRGWNEDVYSEGQLDL